MKRSSVALAWSLVLLGGLLAVSRAADQPAAGGGLPKNLPDPAALIKALKQTPGCLGAELARSEGGKYLLFTWFENRQGLLNWYKSDAHKDGMKKYYGLEPSPTGMRNI